MSQGGDDIWRRRERASTAIVPDGSVINRALLTVITIMTFLACICVGLVAMVHQSAASWLSSVSQEITVQIAPGDTMREETQAALSLLRGTQGIASAEAVSRAQTEAMLAPWLGSDFDLDTLPVPQLIAVSTQLDNPPDLDSLRVRLTQVAPSATLDDHRVWQERLRGMSRFITFGGLGLLALVVLATVACIIFATRGAMQSNKTIIEVLDLVGAEPGYIARAFERHFLRLGLRAGLTGGIAALVVFWAVALFGTGSRLTLAGAQASIFFGDMSLGLLGHAGIALTLATVALLTAITSRLTVSRYLRFAA